MLVANISDIYKYYGVSKAGGSIMVLFFEKVEKLENWKLNKLRFIGFSNPFRFVGGGTAACRDKEHADK